ncbi:MAG TPA: 6-carboxytetrahydropterin synthase [Nitrososphaerales archaeon]|nr:6-carboxytetrahydropterin synthase [Nitrososphaerales archaeon]
MEKTTLVERLAPRLKELERGSYSRIYRKGGKGFRTDLQLAVAEILDSIGQKYARDVKVPGSEVVADFEANGHYLFVDRHLSGKESNSLARLKSKCVLVSTNRSRSDEFDLGLRVVELGAEVGEETQTIFLDDPSFNFDYAHILPHTQKCSVMHGHTSSALVEIVGTKKDGMVVDFGVAKEIIREAVKSLDHKLLINSKYIVKDAGASVTLSFETVHGRFRIDAPKQTTVLLEGEATVENMAQELLSRIAPKMPANVSAVGVYVYEGLNKGTHLLAQIHAREGDRRRGKP